MFSSIFAVFCNDYDTKIYDMPISFFQKDIKENIIARKRLGDFYKRQELGFWKRTKQKIENIVKKYYWSLGNSNIAVTGEA